MKTPLHLAATPGRLARALASLLVGRTGLCATLMLALATGAVGAADGDVDPGFNPNANDIVTSMAVQANGKVVVGGRFTNVGGTPRNSIARLDTDGTLDAGFNPNMSPSTAECASIQADGKIVIGGILNFVGGQGTKYIARLNANGTLDSGFNPNASGYVHCMAIQANGKVVIGGDFRTVGGTPRLGIAQLNTDGTLDIGFNPSATSNVFCLAVQADGKIVIGGKFTTVGGMPRNQVARLNADGTLDPGFDPNVTATNGTYVGSTALQADGKIVIVGTFTNVGGTARNHIARLNADGTLDDTFNPNPSEFVSSVAVQTDGKILIGGGFTTVAGTTRNRIARLNADGTLDPNYNPGANSSVLATAVQADGKIVVGGYFTTMGGSARGYAARLLNGPATQILTVSSTARVQWLRGSSAPETMQVTFEVSTDQTTWALLGLGTRISGGWELAGLSLPPSGFIRARARVTSGFGNGSSGIVEQQAVFPSPAEIVVHQPFGNDLVDGMAGISFGNATVGSSTNLTFTVINSGNANLILTNITKDGLHSGEFTVGALGASTLPPGASTTFSVTFLPSAFGSRTAAIHIASNDSDENPFDIAVVAVGIAPEIAVQQPAGTNLVDSTTSIGFGNVLLGSSNSFTFTITNSGNADLILTNITKDGLHPGDFTVGALGASTLPPGASTTFSVTFLPSAFGSRTAAIHIASNDSDENPFDIALTGVATIPAPEIGVQQPAGTNLVDGMASIDFSTVLVGGSSPVKAFTITNSGGANLILTNVTKDGSHSGDFAVGALGATTLVPGASTTFSVTFSPAASGARSAAIHVASNDSDETPFDITLVGLAVRRIDPLEAWVQDSSDESRAVAVDASGNVVVAGYSDPSGPNFYTAKYAAADGTLLWEKSYNGPGNGDDFAEAVAVDASGNVVVTGSSGNSFNLDYYTAKYAAADGALLWEKRYNGPANFDDKPTALVLDGSGNVIVTGVSRNATNSEGDSIRGDYYTAKYAAADGALLWEKRYNGPANGEDEPSAVAVDGSGNVIVTGVTDAEFFNYNLRGGDYYTAKYAAANGALLWERRYNSPFNRGDQGRAVAVDSNGNVVVTGVSYNAIDIDGDEITPRAYTAKYAAGDGAILWDKRGPNSRNVGVAVDVGGNVIVAGTSFTQASNDDYYTAKYAAANGAILWERIYDGTGSDPNDVDYAEAVAVDSSGNVVVTGTSDGDGTGPDYYTAKYASANGALLWEKRYTGGDNGFSFEQVGSHSLALGPNGMVAVTGYSDSGLGTVVYWESLPPVAISLVPGGVRLRFTGIPDRSYDIERAPALDGPWTILDTVIAPFDGIVEFVDTNPLPGSAFYRASTP